MAQLGAGAADEEAAPVWRTTTQVSGASLPCELPCVASDTTDGAGEGRPLEALKSAACSGVATSLPAMLGTRRALLAAAAASAASMRAAAAARWSLRSPRTARMRSRLLLALGCDEELAVTEEVERGGRLEADLPSLDSTLSSARWLAARRSSMAALRDSSAAIREDGGVGS